VTVMMVMVCLGVGVCVCDSSARVHVCVCMCLPTALVLQTLRILAALFHQKFLQIRLHSHRVLQQRANACTVRWWKATLWKHRLKMLAGINLYGNGTRLTVVMAMMIIMIMIIILDGRNTKFYELTLLYTDTH
jgi:hypothetical protein